MAFRVQPDIFVLQHHPGSRRPDTAQLRPGPRHQFQHRIGFHHIVIGPSLKPPDAVDFLGPGRQHDDRNSPGLGPHFQTTANLDPGQLGHHPVQNDDIRGLFGDQQQRILAIVGLDDVEALGFKVIGQNRPLRRLVLDQKNPWRRGPCHGQAPASLPVASNFGRSSRCTAPVTR